ncbi:MAG: twin-arginine translocase TatA/TatE family subunit [Candidatus Korobacteraceae bacterium]
MNLGMPEMIFILLLALVIVGPKKLPEVARQLGKFLAEFKRASNEFKHQIEAEMLNIELQERAKKQPEGPQVLPPEEPWERLMRPLTDTVSRTRQELVSVATSDPEPPIPSAPGEQPSASAKPANHS